MEGVKVEAVEVATGAVAAETYTDVDGTYELDYLERQQYFLRFTPPTGYGATVARAAGDDVDSDVDHTYGLNTTRAFSMEPAVSNVNIDMGLAFGFLPVEWLDVSVRRVNETHLVKWSTASETNVSHYVVERRMSDDAAFVEIPGKVMAKGNTRTPSHYELADLDVDVPSLYLYRVKQIDFDGKYTYSDIVKVNHSGSTYIEVYPNPARNASNVEVGLTQDATVKVELYDATSKLVKVLVSNTIQRAGIEVYNIDLESIPAGVYNVMISVDEEVTQKQLIRIE